ncbi:hypothetical protein JCM10908_005341 [Rhodotorula pacifica]|uniref:uncharacterized protein n=1 Tax=Rhodotorula pacifica TaxID=1495444 RepID=UPI00317907D7
MSCTRQLPQPTSSSTAHCFERRIQHLDIQTAASGPTKRLRAVALSLDDFPALSTLSSTNSLCRVELVRPSSSLAGSNINGTGQIYVMKTVDKRWAFRMRAQQSHIHELAVLRLGEREEAKQRRIPRLVASFLSPTLFHIVLSHAAGGDLATVLERHGIANAPGAAPTGLPEIWVKGWMAELLDALEWLHSKGWAHRDVKPQNSLLEADGHLLLTDFGSAAPLIPHSTSIARKYCRALIGTPDYIAPEILSHAEALYREEADSDDEDAGGGGSDGDDVREGTPNDELRAYGAGVDLWSAGIVMYELLFGVAPFYAEEIPDTYDRIVGWQEHLRFPETPTVSKAAETAIRLPVLLMDANSRPGFEKVKSHDFFKDVKWDQLRTGKPAFVPLASTVSDPASPSLSRSQRSFAQSFDVDSFMSSPGLSILRPSPSTLVRFRDTEQLYWEAAGFGGLTTLPPEDEFESASPTQAESNASQSHASSKDPAQLRSSSFETPARPRWSSQLERKLQSTGRSRRTCDGLEAWREMQEHAWSVSRSAKKRNAASSGAPSRPRSGGPLDGIDALSGLQTRQERVIKQLDDLDEKYSSLFALAASQSTSVPANQA